MVEYTEWSEERKAHKREENRAAKIESDLSLLKWMAGSNVTLTLVVLAFVLRGHAILSF